MRMKIFFYLKMYKKVKKNKHTKKRTGTNTLHRGQKQPKNFMQSPEMHAAYSPMRKRSTARSTNNFLFDGHKHTNTKTWTRTQTFYTATTKRLPATVNTQNQNSKKVKVPIR